jgi:L-ascorbate metabolism protein UlaG (beta-lactamase superfamily)
MSSVRITLLGHASFRMESDTGEVLYLDPWLDGNPTCDVTVDDVERADVVVATHGHNDHIADAFKLCKKTGASFVGNYELCLTAAKNGLKVGENAFPLNPGGTASVKGFDITGVQAFHSLSMSTNLELGGVPDDMYFRPDGAVCGMVIRFQNGVTVYNTADTSLFSDMQLISQLYGPQIAILPIGGKYTMDIRAGARAASLIRPEVVIPCHYGEKTGQPADVDAFTQGVAFQAAGTQVAALQPGQTLSYTKSSFAVE